MAIVAVEILAVNFPDGRANVVCTYNSPGNDAQGDPIFTGAITSFVCTNNSASHTVSVSFKRNTGAVVFTRTLTPNTGATYTGGGQIKNVEDLPSYSLWSQ